MPWVVAPNVSLGHATVNISTLATICYASLKGNLILCVMMQLINYLYHI